MTTGVTRVRRQPPAAQTAHRNSAPRTVSTVEDHSETTPVVACERTVGQRLAAVLVFLAVLAILAAIILPANLAARG